MNVSSFILEQALRQLGVGESAIRQFSIAGSLSDVNGRGFPKELFQLSAPVVVRGLLNFALLQMRRDWVFPYWVHRQLDPKDPSYVARSQNPVFINSTHRNWTLLGSPNGLHEAIVDRCGLATPLPREWSIDIWLQAADSAYFPSLTDAASQHLRSNHPALLTVHTFKSLQLTQEHFVAPIRGGRDILFQEICVQNTGSTTADGQLIIAVRPFNPEGVAPIEHLSTDGRRFIYVNHSLGLVFSEEPARCLMSNGDGGDIASMLNRTTEDNTPAGQEAGARRSLGCRFGLGNAAAFFPFSLAPGATRKVHCSVALGTETALKKQAVRNSWRVSFDKRKEKARYEWERELKLGAEIQLGNGDLQQALEAHRLALLQLSDGSFISPGPYLYHHFWYRDAVPMCRALDALGFHDRSRDVLNAFGKQQDNDGFFNGPDGEWDSNGAVLFGFLQHFLLTRSSMWLRGHFAMLRRGAEWILKMREKTSQRSDGARGLLPPSLSAEHLGTTDYYYWDTFHALAGLRSFLEMARAISWKESTESIEQSLEGFTDDVRRSIESVGTRLGGGRIPSTPSRPFDESAIGSVCGVYPLGIEDINPGAFHGTVRELEKRFVDERGFLHPIIHSGYNAYLTLHIAQSLLRMGDTSSAWRIARSVFALAGSTFSYPEAIHPRTGGGSMGDGQHGWAAAEVVLFLRAALLEDDRTSLQLFRRGAPLLGHPERVTVKNLPTFFGPVSFSLEPDAGQRVHFRISARYHTGHAPESVVVHLPFRVQKAVASSPRHLDRVEDTEHGSLIRLSPNVQSVLIVKG